MTAVSPDLQTDLDRLGWTVTRQPDGRLRLDDGRPQLDVDLHEIALRLSCVSEPTYEAAAERIADDLAAKYRRAFPNAPAEVCRGFGRHKVGQAIRQARQRWGQSGGFFCRLRPHRR